MPVNLLSAGGGTTTLTTASSASNFTLTLPATTGTVALTSQIPSSVGKVLQVVQGVLTSTQSTTSTTFISSTLSASITPSSASNKILVCVNGGKFYIASNYLLTCQMYKNGSAMSGVYWTVAEGNPVGTNHSFMYLDSPATTSATTYTAYYRTTGGTGYFSDGPSTWGNTYITLMEIAG